MIPIAHERPRMLVQVGIDDGLVVETREEIFEMVSSLAGWLHLPSCPAGADVAGRLTAERLAECALLGEGGHLPPAQPGKQRRVLIGCRPVSAGLQNNGCVCCTGEGGRD